MQTARDVQEFLTTIRGGAAHLFAPRAAMATLIRTHGPTFRRPGSRMLIGGNGAVVRGLSGGCPEADLVTRSRRVIDSGRCERIRYDRNYGFDALIELGCGGELEVLLEPLEGPASLSFLEAVAEIGAQRRPGFMVTGFAVDTEVDVRAVRRQIWSEETLHDGFEDAMLVNYLRRSAPVILRDHAVAYCEINWKGAPWALLYEALTPPIQTLLIGRNVVADALDQLARGLGWSVTRIDPRRHTSGDSLLAFDDAGMKPTIDASTYALVMTYNLETDARYVEALLQTAVPYVGALGSRPRADSLRERLAGPFSDHALRHRLHSPAGLDIGSEDPEEIAVSLVAEIKALSAGRGGGLLSVSSGPIHHPRAVDDFSDAAAAGPSDIITALEPAPGD